MGILHKEPLLRKSKEFILNFMYYMGYSGLTGSKIKFSEILFVWNPLPHIPKLITFPLYVHFIQVMNKNRTLKLELL
jgi:hypothetical protein